MTAPELLISRMKQGGVPFLALAPMASVSTPAFRMLVDHYGGCDLYFSEMISNAGLLNGSPYISSYTSPLPDPDRFIVQLTGPDIAGFERAADFLLQHRSERSFIGIDVNMGCSAPEITRKGAGVMWMERRKEAGELIRRLCSLMPGLLISAKIRLGEKDDPDTLISFCRELEQAGAAFITLHPRIRKSVRARPCDWNRIAAAVKALSIPVIGNGEIKDYPSFEQKYQKFRPSGMMPGRWAVQKPWLFREIVQRSGSPEEEVLQRVDLTECVRLYFDYQEQYLPPDFHVSRTHRFIHYFADNLKFGHSLRVKVQNSRNLDEIRELIFSYFQRNVHEQVLAVMSDPV